jgi:hypothetical protein
VEWGPVVAGAIAGLGSGFLAAVAAPWAQWGVDQRRDRLEHRRALVASWRELLARHYGPSETPEHLLLDEPAYLTLRPHLTSDERRRLEGTADGPIEVVFGRASQFGPSIDWVRQLLTEAIERTERNWKLS